MYEEREVICIGSVLWDVVGRAERHPGLGGDVPGRIRRVPGGVAMNIAMTLARLKLRPVLLTAIGLDAEGEDLIARARALGMEAGHVLRDAALRTDIYMAVECGARGLVAAVADAHSLEAAGARILAPLEDGSLGSASAPYPGVIVLDGNLTEALLARIAEHPGFAAADLRVAPASPGKAGRIAPLAGHARATAYVNMEEAATIAGAAFGTTAEAAEALVGMGFSRAVVSHGNRPAAEAGPGGTIEATPPPVTVARVTGAGDTMMAAHIAAELRGLGGQDALNAALAEAAAYISAPDP